MTKLGDEKTPESSIPTPNTPNEGPNAAQLLQNFLNDNNLELKLSPLRVRQVTDGSMIIEQPNVIVDFRQVNSISKN